MELAAPEALQDPLPWDTPWNRLGWELPCYVLSHLSAFHRAVILTCAALPGTWGSNQLPWEHKNQPETPDPGGAQVLTMCSMGKRPWQKPSVTAPAVTSVIQNWNVLQKWFHFLKTAKQAWFSVCILMLLLHRHISVQWRCCNSNSTLLCHDTGAPRAACICPQNYSDSVGCSPKAWTTKLSGIPPCTHPCASCRFLCLPSSLQLGIQGAHFALEIHFAQRTHLFLPLLSWDPFHSSLDISFFFFLIFKFNDTSLSLFAQHIECIWRGKGSRHTKKFFFFYFIYLLKLLLVFADQSMANL